MICPTCSNEVVEGARFCPFCGSSMPEDPKLIEQYTQQIREFLADGVLEPWEVRESGALRMQLNISESTHQSILAKFEYVDHNTIALETDISDVEMYRANQQCQFRILIRNVEPYAIRRCLVRYQIVQGGEQFEIPAAEIPSRAQIDFTLPFIPQMAGLYEFSGTIDVDDVKGRSYRYQFRGINFTVAPSEQQVINQVHIGDNFTGVLNVGDKKRGNLESELNLDSQWTPVNLKPIPMRRDGNFTVAAFAGQFEPTPNCRLTVQTALGEHIVDISTQDTVSFGRSGAKSTIQLAVEPYLPAHLYHQNLAMSKQISSTHFSIVRENRLVQITDLGSKKGTLRDGQVCYRLAKYPLQTGTRLSIANVLHLTTQVVFEISTNATEPVAVILKRINNMPQKQHVIVFDKVGVWLSRSQLFGDTMIGNVEAPLQIQKRQGVPYLCNVSAGQISVQGLPLHNGESIPLGIGQHLTLSEGTITVTGLST